MVKKLIFILSILFTTACITVPLTAQAKDVKVGYVTQKENSEVLSSEEVDNLNSILSSFKQSTLNGAKVDSEFEVYITDSFQKC